MKLSDIPEGKRLYDLNERIIAILSRALTAKNVPDDILKKILERSESINKLTDKFIELAKTKPGQNEDSEAK